LQALSALKDLAREVGSTGRQVPLAHYFWRCSYHTTLRAFYGTRFPEVEARTPLRNLARDASFIFLCQMIPFCSQDFLEGVLPAGRALRNSRNGVRNAMLKWQQDPEATAEASDGVREILECFDKANTPASISSSWNMSFVRMPADLLFVPLMRFASSLACSPIPPRLLAGSSSTLARHRSSGRLSSQRSTRSQTAL
jgi:hypothetical protein